MVELARQRVGAAGTFKVANLAAPLLFLEDDSFDLVLSALVLEYVQDWRGFTPVRITMPTYRRSLAETLNPIIDAGFRLERLLEPRPTPEFLRDDPRHFQELEKQPCFLCIRAAKMA